MNKKEHKFKSLLLAIVLNWISLCLIITILKFWFSQFLWQQSYIENKQIKIKQEISSSEKLSILFLSPWLEFLQCFSWIFLIYWLLWNLVAYHFFIFSHMHTHNRLQQTHTKVHMVVQELEILIMVVNDHNKIIYYLLKLKTRNLG